jgi:hypothetical protein
MERPTLHDIYAAGSDIVLALGSDATPEDVSKALQKRFPTCTFRVEMPHANQMDINCVLPAEIDEIEIEISV